MAEVRAYVDKITSNLNSLGEGALAMLQHTPHAWFYTQVPGLSSPKSQVPAGVGGSWTVIGCHHLWLALHGGGGWKGQQRLINNAAVCSEGPESKEGEENILNLLFGIK